MLNNRVGKNIAIIVCIALVLNVAAVVGTQIEVETSATGGPDAYGYSWTDSMAPSPTVSYNWIEISGTGTNSGVIGDDSYGSTSIGFTFSFYGNSYTTAYFSTNGLVNFGSGSADYSNDNIPRTNTPNNIVAAFWDDLYDGNGTIYYQTIGSAPNRQFVVEWYNWYMLAGPGPMTFEAILNETGEIWLQYNTLGSATSGSASVGIENSAGTIGLQYCCNSSLIQPNLAIRFSLASQPNQVSLTPPSQASGGAPGSNVDYTFTVSNTGTQADTYNLSVYDQVTFDGTSWTKYGMVINCDMSYDTPYAYDPDVIKDGGIYKMWYSGYDGSICRIIYANSSNGINWTKYGIVLSGAGGYEGSFTSDPTVLKTNGEYKMWYMGYDGSTDRILYANSSDGITWQKQGLAIDIGGTGENLHVAYPTVIREPDGTYKMWYSAKSTAWQIFYAISSDGILWTKQGLVMANGYGSYETVGVLGPEVVKDVNNVYRMWYYGNNGHSRVMYATSLNGINWTKLGMAVDYGGAYETDGAESPAVIIDGNYAKMWYTGSVWSPASARILYATSPYTVQVHQWPVVFRDIANTHNITNISVPASSNAQFIARVSIPGSAAVGTYDVATLKATSQNNSAISDTATINTSATLSTPHLPIRINSNADFNAAHGVSGGNGTVWSPWIIENYDINGTGYGYCIYVGNTTNYFTIRNCNLHHANGINSYPYYWSTALTCNQVQNANIVNNSLPYNNEMAIFFLYCSNCIISNNNASYNYGYTIYFEYSIFNTIKNNQVRNGDNCGIAVCWSSHNNTVENNSIISMVDSAIYMYAANGNIIKNNTARGYDYCGINLIAQCNYNMVIENDVSYNSQGLYFESTSNYNRIYHNNIHDNTDQADDYGINYWNDSYPSGGNYWDDYTGSDGNGDGIGETPYIIDGNSQDYYPLVAPYVQPNGTVTTHAPIRINSNADFNSAHGVTDGNGTVWSPWVIENYDINGTGYGFCIYVGNTTNYFKIKDCIIHDASGASGDENYFSNSGIITYFASNGTMENNTAMRNSYGLRLRSSNYNTIKNNTAYENALGCYIQFSSNDIIKNNNASNNTGYGISMYASSYNVIEHNIANFNGPSPMGIGITVSQSTYITIINNIANSNLNIGINYLGNDYSNIINNTIEGNQNYGIYLSWGSDNSFIYHNKIVNNTNSAYDEDNNYWNATYPSGGNYWSDYTGIDIKSGPLQDQPGSDGIGDTPYNISGGSNKDYYPLMQPGGQTNTSTTHAPIRINMNSEFDAAHGVTSGNGTVWSPWLIENYNINGTGYGYCIYVGNTSNYFIIRNCYLHEASGNSGTYFWDSGLTLSNVINGKIVNNTASFNRYGFSFYSSSNIFITNNTANSNNQDGIYLGGSSGNTIANNTANSNNWSPGIYLSSSNNNAILNNNASFNGDMQSGYGIQLWSSSGNTIANNRAYGNGNASIFLTHSSNNNIITNNTASNSGLWGGIVLRSGSNINIIANNTITSNSGSGIIIFYGDMVGGANCINNIIINNTISNNSHGVDLWTGGNNMVYHNNFINNANQASGGSGTGKWNDSYPSGGNYWSDYTGVDVKSGPLQNQPGSDGIGDTPYVIDADSRDYYPLMAPFGTMPPELYFQVQSPFAGYKNLSNESFEPVIQTSISPPLNATGDFKLDASINGWVSQVYTSNMNMSGNWKFRIYGKANSTNAHGYLYAVARRYSDGATLFTTGYDDEDIVNYTSSNHMFYWEYNVPAGFVLPTGDRFYVEPWVHVTQAIVQQPDAVLLVDADFYDDGLVAFYNSTLQNNGITDAYTWDVYGNNGPARGKPTAANMAPYAIVIWIPTRDMTGNATANPITATDETQIAAYLSSASGHNFLLSNTYYTYNTDAGSCSYSAGDFAYDYLGLGSVTAQSFSEYSVEGVIGDTVFDGFGPAAQDWSQCNWGGYGYCESEELTAGLGTLCTLNDGLVANGIRYNTSTFKTMFFGFPFETLMQADADNAMGRILNWFSMQPATNNTFTFAYDNLATPSSLVPSLTEVTLPPFFSIPVIAGWNLISVPLVPNNTALPDVLLDIGGDTTWDKAQWYDPMNSADHWKSYYTGWSSVLNDLTDVDETMGVWLHVTSLGDGFINVTGTLPSNVTVPMYAGWNMVGFPSQRTIYTVADFKRETGATVLEGFDANDTYRTKVLPDAYVMKRGEGYWACVSSDTAWSVPGANWTPPPQPLMTLSKTGPAWAFSGQIITYWINFTNNGTGWAYNVIITETYPPDVTYISSIPVPTIGNNVWIIGAVAPGATASIQITVSINLWASYLINYVELAYENVTGVTMPLLNTTATTIILAPNPMMTFDKTAPATAWNGSLITYYLNYSNVGPDTAWDIEIYEYYPTGVTLVTSTPPPTSGNDYWYIDHLASGNSGSIEITVFVGLTGSLANYAELYYYNFTGSQWGVNDTAITVVGQGDITPPASFINTTSPYWRTSTMVIDATANDTESGVTNVQLWYRYSSNNATWGSWQLFGTDPASPWSWSFTWPSGSGWYQFYTIATDNVGNVETAPPTPDDEKGYDAVMPVSSVNPISPYIQPTSPLALTATATDSVSGVSIVELWCRYSTDNATWGGWWMWGTDSTSPYSWSFTYPNGTGYYQFYSRSKDRAANYEAAPGTCDTLCRYLTDTTPPTSNVNAISSYWNNANPITITATASDSGSGVWQVELWYRFSSSNSSWGSWQLFGTDSASPWSWSFTWPSGNGYYQFYSRARDNAGNYETASGTYDTYAGFDNIAPSSSVNSISPYIQSTTPYTITATATDSLSLVLTVGLWFRYSADNASWGSWVLFSTDTASPWSWSFTWPMGMGYYQFYSIATDRAANSESAPGGADTICRYTNDIIPPSGSPTPANGTLNYSIGAGIYTIAFSEPMNTGFGSVATNLPGASAFWSMNWLWFNITYGMLASSTIYYVNLTGFIDLGGNSLPQYKWWFSTGDFTPPISSINAISPFSTNADSLTVNATASDSGGTVVSVEMWYRHSPDNASWTSWLLFGTDMSSPWSWVFDWPNGVGYYQFYSRAWDNGGNYEAAPAGCDAICYFYDITPPAHSNEFPAIDWYTNDPTPEISVRVTDTGSSVDSSTLRFYIEGFSVLYTLANITDGYNVSYQHGTPYPDGKVVRCRIVARDFSGNLLDFTWNFTVDLSAPVHSNEYPAPNSTSSNLTPVISVLVTDVSPINTGSIKLYVQGYSVFYTLTAVAGGYNVSYWHEGGFNQGENVICRITASDVLGNSLDYTWNFIVDGVPPLSCAECPILDWWEYVQVTATANDTNGSGVSMIELWYRWSSNNNTWGVWSLFGTDTNGSDGWSWTVYGYPYFQFYTRAWDNAGNYEDAPPVYDAWAFVKHMPKTKNNASVELHKSSEPGNSDSAANTATPDNTQKEITESQAGTQNNMLVGKTTLTPWFVVQGIGLAAFASVLLSRSIILKY